MAERLPDCPLCGSSTRIFKFSQVYIASITETADRGDADQKLLSNVFIETDDPTQRQAILSLFSPPVTKSISPRSIHPDLAVLVFGLAAFAIISTTLLERTNLLWIAYGGLSGVLILYALMRRKILTRDKVHSRAHKGEFNSTEEMIQRWNRLFYCARDNCVFDPARGDWAGLEDAYHYLRDEKSSQEPANGGQWTGQ